MYPNKQFVIDNLKILDRCTIYHILYNFDRLYNRYEGLRVFMGKVLEVMIQTEEQPKKKTKEYATLNINSNLN